MDTTVRRSTDGRGALPPGQSAWAGRVIALVVFFGVVITTAVIVFLPEPTTDFEDTVRLYPNQVLTVRLVGDRGVLEVLNEGPLAVTVSSPVNGGPLTDPIDVIPGEFLRRDIRGVGAFDVVNLGESVTTIRWRGGGPEPIYVSADPPRDLGE